MASSVSINGGRRLMGIDHVAKDAADDRPFDIRAKRATLASIPYRVELNDIATMLIHHHEAAQ